MAIIMSALEKTYKVIRVDIFIEQELVDESEEAVVKRGREVAVAVITNLHEAMVLGNAHRGVDCAGAVSA
jgi:hypothetical protein